MGHFNPLLNCCAFVGVCGLWDVGVGVWGIAGFEGVWDVCEIF